MSISSYLRDILSSKKDETETPEGLCPNCRGRQEYSGQFFKSVKVEGIDTNNIDEKKGWIQAYAEKNLSGIQLRHEDANLVCNNCKIRYEVE